MLTREVVLKVRNWFAERGLEFTPQEVEISMTNNCEYQMVTPSVVESMQRDPFVAPLLKDYMAYLLELKQGET